MVAICHFLRAPQKNVSCTTGPDLPRSDIAAPRYNFMRSRSARRNSVASMGRRTKPVRPPHKTTHEGDYPPFYTNVRIYSTHQPVDPALYDIQTQQPLTDQRPEAFSLRSRCTQLAILVYIARRRADDFSAELGYALFLKCRIHVHAAFLGPFVTE